MATPLTPDQILAAAQASGQPVYEMAGWRDRCRCHNGSHAQGVGANGRGWGSINGIVVHHTAGGMYSGNDAINYTARTLNVGRPDTPGPLVQFTIDADGRIIIAAAGRSNHAGLISSAALAHMVAADFSLSSPYQDVRGADVDGNTHTFGIEIQAPMVPNDAQVTAAVNLCAAICRVYGWTGQEVCGHGEIAASKAQVDPGLDMGAFRRAVMALTSGAATPSANVAVAAPVPAPTTVSLSRLLAAIAHDGPAAQGATSYPNDVHPVEAALAAEGLLRGSLVDGSAGTSSFGNGSSYQVWQLRLGYKGTRRGQAADGYPGMTSLTRLGQLHGFNVTG